MERLKSLQTLRQTAKYSEGSFQASLVLLNKRPDRYRQEFIVQGMDNITAYDGKTGWRIAPFSGRKDPELLSEDDLKGVIEEADIEGQLVDYKQKGHQAELLGHDDVEGTECYKIKLVLKNRDVRYYYLDADSFFEIKVETQRLIRGAFQYRDTILGDYEQVNGLYFPFALDTGEKGDPNRAKIAVEKIEVNIPLPDNLFSFRAPPGAKLPTSGQ